MLGMLRAHESKHHPLQHPIVVTRIKMAQRGTPRKFVFEKLFQPLFTDKARQTLNEVIDGVSSKPNADKWTRDLASEGDLTLEITASPGLSDPYYGRRIEIGVHSEFDVRKPPLTDDDISALQSYYFIGVDTKTGLVTRPKTFDTWHDRWSDRWIKAVFRFNNQNEDDIFNEDRRKNEFTEQPSPELAEQIKSLSNGGRYTILLVDVNN